MGIPDHLTCLLRNLCASQEATVRTRHGTTDWFKIGKGVCQGCILSPCLFNFSAEYIMRNARLDEAQMESILPGDISLTLDMQIAPTLWQKVKKDKRASWWKWKEKSEKAGLKLKIQKLRSWHSVLSLDGKQVGKQWKKWETLFWGGSKITADSDWSHEIKRHLLLGRKVMTNLAY